MEQSRRIIGVRHRIKRTADGEARPTQLYIIEDNCEPRELELPDETAELDFLLGRFPTSYRRIEGTDVPDGVLQHQVRRRGRGQNASIEIPTSFDGLREGDCIATALGGSGHRLMYAFSNRGDEIGAIVYAIPPKTVHDSRGENTKNDDSKLLAEMLVQELLPPTVTDHELQEPTLFYKVTAANRELIFVAEAYKAYRDAMKARIGCGQRLRQRVIGAVFLNPDGRYPEGNVEDEFDECKANDRIYQALEAEENSCKLALVRAVRTLQVWKEIFEPLEGCGEVTAAGIITAVGDIRRFIVEPDADALDVIRATRTDLKQRARFEADLDKVAHMIEANTTSYRKTQLVRTWKRDNGLEEEAALLDEAIELYKAAHRIKHGARKKTQNKIRAYFGLHVLPDGSFPRRRAGQTANWHGAARQAYYQLGEQFGKWRQKSVWGLRLAGYKERMKEKYGDDKKPFAIHRAATWRTLSRLSDDITRKWLNIERGVDVDE